MRRSTSTQGGLGAGPGDAAEAELEGEGVLVVVMLAVLAACLLRRRRRQHEAERRLALARRPAYIYVRWQFCFEGLPQSNLIMLTRFNAQQIRRVVPLLKLDDVPWRSRLRPPPETAFCVLCARLAYPGRWHHLCDVFGRSEAWLSTVFNDVCTFLAATFGPLLWWHPQLTEYRRLEEFSEGVERVVGVRGLWGFVDGTFRGHCRPFGAVEQALCSLDISASTASITKRS